jgi:hypothetical protein
MSAIKLLGTSASLGVANNMGFATMVRVVNTNSGEQTVTVANTVAPENGGGISGSVVIEAFQTEIIIKAPTDTIVASSADVKATKVARY